MSVDDLLPTWTPAEVASLNLWRQGVLVSLDHAVWLEEAPGGFAGHSGRVSETGYMALTSQTCDIVLASPGDRHPFVQGSPVRDLTVFPQDKIDAIVRGDVVEYVYLSDPPVEGARWAVDLRVSVPVSKRILSKTHPTRGFTNEHDELEFAERVAAKYSRPAMHDAITTGTVRRLRTLVERVRKTELWCDDVEQFRLIVTEGTRLAPKRVRLLVLTDVKFDAAERSRLREFWKSEKKLLHRGGIVAEAIAFLVVAEVELKEYRGSIPIDVSALGRGYFA